MQRRACGGINKGPTRAAIEDGAIAIAKLAGFVLVFTLAALL